MLNSRSDVCKMLSFIWVNVKIWFVSRSNTKLLFTTDFPISSSWCVGGYEDFVVAFSLIFSRKNLSCPEFMTIRGCTDGAQQSSKTML